jgi:hypothetical protein
MHRIIEITVPPGQREELLRELERLDDVISLSLYELASRKPKGDVVIVNILNRGADAVLGCADRIKRNGGSISVVRSLLPRRFGPGDPCRPPVGDISQLDRERCCGSRDETTAFRRPPMYSSVNALQAGGSSLL